MRGKGKIKALILSVSVLILLILIYVSNQSANQRANGGEATPSKASETFEKLSQSTNAMFDRLSAWSEKKAYERAERKEAKDVLLNRDTAPEVNAENPSVDDTSNTESEVEEEYVEYVPPFEISLPDGLKIPDKVGDISFREISDYVYAADHARLYDNPACQGEQIRESDKWEQFLRVGISKDCCYQLITADGMLVYSDGTHFRRHREDMPLSENILMPKEKISLDVDFVSQFPTLTNGSEVTALATVLNYLDFDVTKDELSESFLPMGKPGKVSFFDTFVGAPSKRNAYGCYADAIVRCADAYFESIESTYRAKNISGETFNELMIRVKEGTPVIVWTMEDYDREPEYTAEWIVDGEYMVWKDNMHCVVLIGYDTVSGTALTSDPMYGITEYDLKTFIKGFKEFYSQAVVVEGE